MYLALILLSITVGLLLVKRNILLLLLPISFLKVVIAPLVLAITSPLLLVLVIIAASIVWAVVPENFICAASDANKISLEILALLFILTTALLLIKISLL